MPILEEQISRCLSILHCEGGESPIFSMKLRHPPEVDGADHVHIVQNEWRFEVTWIFKEETGGLLQAAPRIEQYFFARNLDTHAEAFIFSKVFDNHIGEVMDVNDHVANVKRTQARQRNFQHRATAYIHQSFGAIVCERPKARTEAGGQNHSFHLFRFSSSRCRTTTSTPFLPLNLFANCSAK